MMAFLLFICNICKVHAFSSVHENLLGFNQLYNRINGHNMNTNDGKEALLV